MGWSILVAFAFSIAIVSAVELGYVGVDAPNGDLTTLTGITSSLACAQACDNTANCHAWVWSYPGSGCPTNANMCWLKGPSGIGTRIIDNCREIGYATREVGVDRSGGDLPGMPIVFEQTSSSTCAAACKAQAGCVAWAFDSCGKQNCWLKSSLTGTSSNGCRESGVQGNVNIDLSGADLPGTPTVLSPYATTTDCSDLCSTTPGCNSWAFVTPGVGCETQNSCWLKSASPAVNSGTPQSCRASLSQPGISPKPAACGNGNICHYNNCPYTLNLYQTNNGDNGGGSKQVCTLNQGQSCSLSLSSGWGGNFKHNWNGQSLAEFLIGGYANSDYYDVSYIVGFDLGLKIEVPGGTTLDCPKEACNFAYHQPNDKQTYSSPTGNHFVVTWCPSA